MTVQEVREIKEEKSRLTRNMTIAQLKEYYANSLREFNLAMESISGGSDASILATVVAEEKCEYITANEFR